MLYIFLSEQIDLFYEVLVHFVMVSHLHLALSLQQFDQLFLRVVNLALVVPYVQQDFSHEQAGFFLLNQLL